MSKYEYKIVISIVEHHMVFVMADNEEQAKDIALGKFHSGDKDVEETYSNIEAVVDWSDEED